MSELRCRHCGIRHDERLVICPATGLAIGPGSSLPPRGPMHTPRALIPPAPNVPRAMGAPPSRGFGAPPPPPLPNAPNIPGRPAQPASTSKPAEAASSRKPERQNLLGHVIGDKYRVKALLGEGGMGAVYEAEHLAIGRVVAVKVLHPKHAQQADSVARLRHEARIAGSIGHPNICEIYDLGRLDDGAPYLVMERLVGETLDQRIKREGALPERDIVDVMQQVLSALSAAHGKAIIHRDLKPENVFLVRRAGTPPVAKLLDFGISKAIDEDTATDLTMPGIVMGTPYYMAPEQARGDRGLDHRVDLWAAGVILYEALTGRRPFVARNYNALLVQILTSKHRPLSEVRPGVTRSLERVVDRALAKMREDRFQTAAEFQEALRRALEPEPPPPPPPPPPRAKQPARMSFEESEDDETMVLSFSRKDLGLPIAPPRSSRQGPASVAGPPSSFSGPPTSAAGAASAPSPSAPLPPMAAPPVPPPAPPPPPSYAAPSAPAPSAPSGGAPPPTLQAAQLANMGVGSGRVAWLPPPPAPMPPPAPPPAYAAQPLPPPPPRPAAPPSAPAARAQAPRGDDEEEEHTLVDPPSFADDRPTLVRPFKVPLPEKGT